MKLKLHSQSQSRGWILHWSASNYGKSCGLLLFSLFFCTFLSAPSWSLRAGCVLNISQWWLILWAAAWSCVKSFWFHRQILQFLSATPESFSQPFFISLYLCLLDSLYLFFFCCQSFSLSWTLVSLQIYLQHATCGLFSQGFEVCLLCIVVCRTPKLPLWSATFEIWRMRSKCWRQTAYWTQRTEKRR